MVGQISFNVKNQHKKYQTHPAKMNFDFKLLIVVLFVRVPSWCIPGLSGPPTWTPPPFITCGTGQLFFDFLLRLFFVVARRFFMPGPT